MKKKSLSLITSILLTTNLMSAEKLDTLEEKVRIKSFDVDLKLDIYKDQKEEYEVLLKYENIIKKIPKEKDKIEEYYKTQIENADISYIRNQLVLHYGEYIKNTKKPKDIQKFYEKLLLFNGLTEETLGKIYFELMKIGYERYGNVKANYYYEILVKNFQNKEILADAKKMRINILIKENNLTKARRIIINELKEKDERTQLFLLVNLLDINIKLEKTENIGKVLEKVLENLRFNKSKEAKELIDEIVEIDYKKLTDENKKYFEDFYNTIYNNSGDFVEEIVVPAMIKDIETLLETKKWEEGNEKLLSLLQYYLDAKDYRQKRFDYYVTNYLMEKISLQTLKEKYEKEEDKSIKRDLEVLTLYENLKNSEINDIKYNLEKMVSADVRTLTKYGLKKSVLIEKMLELYMKRFVYSKNEDKKEGLKFFSKYTLIKNKYDLLTYDEKINIVKKVMNEKQYEPIKEEIFEHLKNKKNKMVVDRYIYTMLLIEKERWTNAADEIERINEKKPFSKEELVTEILIKEYKDILLNKKEKEELEKLYIDMLIKMGSVKRVKNYLKREIRKQDFLSVAIFLDNIWKGYNYLKNQKQDFMNRAIIIRLLNISNAYKVYSYRPEIDYELFDLILKEGKMYEFQALQILLNIEKNPPLINSLKPLEKQELFYKIAMKYEDMFLGNSSLIYLELCMKEDKVKEDIYTKLCSEKLENLKQEMKENNINWQ